jgi:hypothetical protein
MSSSRRITAFYIVIMMMMMLAPLSVRCYTSPVPLSQLDEIGKGNSQARLVSGIPVTPPGRLQIFCDCEVVVRDFGLKICLLESLCRAADVGSQSITRMVTSKPL